MTDLRLLADTFRMFSRIMENEAKENPSCRSLSHHPYEYYQMANYLLEVARSCILPRGWCEAFSLPSTLQVTNCESVGSHTYLMSTMMELLLRSGVKQKVMRNGYARDGYNYLEIMEAVRLHDLPENAIGDWLDNGDRDEEEKSKLEDTWYESFRVNYPDCNRNLVEMAYQLLLDMRLKQSPTGKMLYMADKTALVIAALAYDKAGHPFVMHIGAANASERDKQEMCICEWQEAGYRKASEMFTTDILHIREITQYDETGFFTAVLVMCTLIVNGKWYDWREKDYEYP